MMPGDLNNEQFSSVLKTPEIAVDHVKKNKFQQIF